MQSKSKATYIKSFLDPMHEHRAVRYKGAFSRQVVWAKIEN